MDDTQAAMPVVRGCGTRKKGGIYLETGLSPWGTPVTDFLCDPPIPLADARDIAAVGTQLQNRNGVWHVLDWVGQEHYPNVADWVEETKKFGISRRIAETVDFSKLTAESRLIVIHARAHIDNFEEYRDWKCPKHYESHRPDYQPEDLIAKPMCAGIWWEDVSLQENSDEGLSLENGRTVLRKMPSFSYYARRTPEEITPVYRPAIFGMFPISRLVVVNGGDRHDEKLASISRSQLPFAEVEG